MTATIFSFRALAVCWASVLASLAGGAVALQLTAPAPIIEATAMPAAPAIEVPAPPAPPTIAPMPFQNRSLAALLPPVHAVAPLPVPPIPPSRHAVHAEPRRGITVYAAVPAPAYDPPEWNRPVRYQYERPSYPYGGPGAYYGW